MQSVHEQQTGVTAANIKGKRSGLALLSDNTSNTPIKTKQSMKKSSDNKENRPLVKKSPHHVYMDPKPKQVVDRTTQTGICSGVEDLTSSNACAAYWELVAERRGDELNKSQQENIQLHEKVQELQRENTLLEDISTISEQLATVLQEVLGEDETTKELIDSISQIKASRKSLCDKSINTSAGDEPSTFLEYDCSTNDSNDFNDSVDLNESYP